VIDGSGPRVSGRRRGGKAEGVTDQPHDPTAVDEAAASDHEAASGEVDRTGGPVDDDAMARADGLTTPEGVAEEYDDMLERGARQEGEGRVP
jgi:hypothetical protein